MAITLSTVAGSSFVTQAVVLAIVGIGITLLVYGVVAVIVKADDVGLAMANRGGLVSGPIGRTIVRLMPGFLQTLSLVGTAAMLWVGGGHHPARARGVRLSRRAGRGASCGRSDCCPGWHLHRPGRLVLQCLGVRGDRLGSWWCDRRCCRPIDAFGDALICSPSNGMISPVAQPQVHPGLLPNRPGVPMVRGDD